MLTNSNTSFKYKSLNNNNNNTTIKRSKNGSTYSQSETFTFLFIITSIWMGGITTMLLWMNGTIGSNSSVTNYQYNATGIGLFVFFEILALISNVILCLWFLVATSEPIFTKQDIERITHQAVNDYNQQVQAHKISIPDYEEQLYQRGLAHFDQEILQNSITNREKIIATMQREDLLDFIYERFKQAFPRLIVPNAKWAFNEVGGGYARQRMIFLNFCGYVCLWGSEISLTAFSGYYGSKLNEGDVMIIGDMKSGSPESEKCLVGTYKFGNTSSLVPGDRRIYWIDGGTYMISYALHEGTNMLGVFWPGAIAPYLFENHDSKSFKAQMGDALHGIWLWIIYRLS